MTDVKFPTSIPTGDAAFNLEIHFSAARADPGDTFVVDLDPRLVSLRSSYQVFMPNSQRVMLNVAIAPAQAPAGPIATFTFTGEVAGLSGISGFAKWGLKFADKTIEAGAKTLLFGVRGGVPIQRDILVEKTFEPGISDVSAPTKVGWETFDGGPTRDEPRVQYVLIGGPGPFQSITLRDTAQPNGTENGAPWAIDCAMPYSAAYFNRDTSPSGVPAQLRDAGCAEGAITATFDNVPDGLVPVVTFFAKSTQPLSEQGRLTFENTATYTSTGTPFPGGEFSHEAKLSVTQDFAAGADGRVTLTAPTIIEFDCSAPGVPVQPTLTLPANGDGVTYASSGTVGPGNTVTVTATLDEGALPPAPFPANWTLTGERTAVFTHTFAASRSCIEQVSTLPLPTVSQATCVAPGQPTIPTYTLVTPEGFRGATIAQTGSPLNGGTVVATATLLDGFEFPATLPTGWVLSDDARSATHTVVFDNPTCITAIGALPVPVAHAPVCQGDGTYAAGWLEYFVSEDLVGVRLTDGAPTVVDGVQRLTIIATGEPGYGFIGDLTAGWTKDPSSNRAVYVQEFELPECADVPGEGGTSSPTPSETTEAPSSPSPSPSETTEAPSSPSPSPSETTEAPSSPFPTPSETEGVPTSPSPSVTDGVPGLPSPSPSVTTEVSGSPSPSPSETTEVPGSPSPSPSETTEVPGSPSPSPTDIEGTPESPKPTAGTTSPSTPAPGGTSGSGEPSASATEGAPVITSDGPDAGGHLPSTGADSAPKLPILGAMILLGLLLIGGSVLRRRATQG
ncbi:LPXTG cell wall anchor domain-containing protein [Mycetocola tolaasinivorans]|uniref:LPXTG cell wall anchor domain-containing protein n=1 Tax=Mycetocola tolaasinivorans TaxID=76635 RepID=A0A3L6ZZS1_9MICO|nr:LPXTG cell wall anchor domain-containing protein [Mycetocola tolaasinivorans]